MTGRVSAATERAIERYRRGGESAYAAAKAEGVHPGTMYRNPEYQKIRDSRKK